MKITLRSNPGHLSYTGTNAAGHTQHFSGTDEACRPMESLLMSMAACSAIDVELFLAKMRTPAAGVTVEVAGERADATPAVFTKVHLHYIISGDVPEKKAAKAVAMSMDQYCSVSTMLRAAVDITHSFEVRGAGAPI